MGYKGIVYHDDVFEVGLHRGTKQHVIQASSFSPAVPIRRIDLLSKAVVMASVMVWVVTGSVAVPVLMALVLSLFLWDRFNQKKVRARLSTPPVRDRVILEIQPADPTSETTDSHIRMQTCQAYSTEHLMHASTQGNTSPQTCEPYAIVQIVVEGNEVPVSFIPCEQNAAYSVHKQVDTASQAPECAEPSL